MSDVIEGEEGEGENPVISERVQVREATYIYVATV